MRKYGAPLESVAVASQRTGVPELVGVVVDEPTRSCASIVHCGGVFKTVMEVVAMPVCACTLWSSSAPRLRRNITAKMATPINDVSTVTLPAVFNDFGKLLMCCTLFKFIKAHSNCTKFKSLYT
jgi:hypothetical protein